MSRSWRSNGFGVCVSKQAQDGLDVVLILDLYIARTFLCLHLQIEVAYFISSSGRVQN